ncbi:MAG: glutathione S-transferase C-terminal domain-containing protein [Gammaproteobacteria bacterium]|nr:MAG: glutathione S-transferase C-terminal domain-containing protein [Gammaproteobacteria bacterium]
MITLYQYYPALGLRSASPFCIKLETWLRIVGLDYQVECLLHAGRAPKKKLPFIKHNGSVVADSTLIIDYLKQAFGCDPDKGLSDRDRGVGTAVMRMLEEHYYWTVVYSRWIDDKHWPVVKKAYFEKAPLVIRLLIPSLARRQVRRDLWGQGLGRHTVEDIERLGAEDVMALSRILADKSYMLGEFATTVDAVAYAFIVSTLVPGLDSLQRRTMQDCANLCAYHERMTMQYFSKDA